jgi:hypothetical protein
MKQLSPNSQSTGTTSSNAASGVDAAASVHQEASTNPIRCRLVIPSSSV